jgi:hypothetical protein
VELIAVILYGLPFSLERCEAEALGYVMMGCVVQQCGLSLGQYRCHRYRGHTSNE